LQKGWRHSFDETRILAIEGWFRLEDKPFFELIGKVAKIDHVHTGFTIKVNRGF